MSGLRAALAAPVWGTLSGAADRQHPGKAHRAETASLIAPRATRHRWAYQFLRTVEHRLQILDERAVRCLPHDPLAVEQLSAPARHWQRSWVHRRAPPPRWRGPRLPPPALLWRMARLHRWAGGRGRGTPAVLPRSPLGETLLTLDTEEARQHVRQYWRRRVLRVRPRPGRRRSAWPASAGTSHPAGAPGAAGAGGTAAAGGGSRRPDPDAALSFVAELAQEATLRGSYGIGEGLAREVLCRLGAPRRRWPPPSAASRRCSTCSWNPRRW